MRCMECDRPSLNLLEFLGKNFLPLVIIIIIHKKCLESHNRFCSTMCMKSLHIVIEISSHDDLRQLPHMMGVGHSGGNPSQLLRTQDWGVYTSEADEMGGIRLVWGARRKM